MTVTSSAQNLSGDTDYVERCVMGDVDETLAYLASSRIRTYSPQKEAGWFAKGVSRDYNLLQAASAPTPFLHSGPAVSTVARLTFDIPAGWLRCLDGTPLLGLGGSAHWSSVLLPLPFGLALEK